MNADLNDLINDFNKSCNFNDLDEYTILKNACSMQLSNNIYECQMVLNETIQRYRRYLTNINNWKNFDYIRNEIAIFMELPHDTFSSLIKKLQMMKKIDLELFEKVCDFHGIVETDSDDEYGYDDDSDDE